MATYKVKKGETLRDVAAKAGISIKDLIAFNPEIKSPNIKPGQVINISNPAQTDAIIQQYADAASGDTALKGRYGPGSGLTAPGTIATQATPVTATPAVPVKTATATATATPIAINQDKKIAEATAAGNKAVEDINEILDSEFETAEEEVETPPRTVKSRTPNYNPISGKLDGYTIVYSDGTTDFEAVEIGEEDPNEPGESTTTYEAPDGKIFTDLGLYNAYLDKVKLDEKRERGESAYKLLYEEFDRYGLASLVTDLEEFIKDGLSKAELTLKLRGTKTYQTRFAANAERVKNGYAAISEAEYISLEDQYQNIMRNYGLPESYYARGSFGTQEGFQKLIANDVDNIEFEERVMAGQERVLNSNPEVLAALRSFYPGITNGDILAYTLDPTNAITEIRRKVTAAEIGGAAMQAGLKTNLTRADELSQAGITKAQAQQGFQTVAEVAPRGGQLAAMYGEDPYTQTTAEQEVFGLSGSVDAAKQRRKLVGLERAEFSGQSGMSQGALGRERAGNF
jgi:LysM repeat protein